MKEYVLILPIVSGCKLIPLVTKDKPEWQIGKLNLIGGSIEDSETPEVAAIRELEEESGIKTLEKAVNRGKIRGSDFTVHCLTVDIGRTPPYLNPRECETQKVDWYDWDIVKYHDSLIPNLLVVIPLLRMRVNGWTINFDIDRTQTNPNSFNIVVNNI